MKRQNEFKEKIFDEALAYACKEECIRELNDIDSQIESEEEYQFSEQFEKNMDALFAQERKKEKFKRRLKNTKKFAACIAVVLLVGFATTMSVEAWKIRFFNFVIEVSDEFFEFRTREKNVNQITKDEANLMNLPEYIPNDFKIESNQCGENLYTIVFSNGKDQIIYEQYNAPYILKKEGASDECIEKIEINGEEAYIVTENKLNRVIWNIQEKGYRISSSYNKDELVKMAKSISKNK